MKERVRLEPLLMDGGVTQDDALLAILENHNGSLRRIARAYAGFEGEEDDLYQEIVMQAWRSLPSFRGESGAGTWLYRVALNTALTWRRRTRRHTSERGLLSSADYAAGLASHGSTRTEAAILEDFLGSLSGPNHTVLLLYMEGLSHQEIAEVAGVSVSAVGVRIHRMKQAFTERYVER